MAANRKRAEEEVEYLNLDEEEQKRNKQMGISKQTDQQQKASSSGPRVCDSEAKSGKSADDRKSRDQPEGEPQSEEQAPSSELDIDEEQLIGGGSRGPLTWNLVFAVCASAVGSSFQHGYNLAVMNAPETLISQFINETYGRRHEGRAASSTDINLIFGAIVSIFCVGGCLGALLTAPVADRFGRKEGLLYNNLLVLLACPLMVCAKPLHSYELLLLGRLLIGLNAGLNAGLAPLYLNEIAPINLRGSLGTIYQLVITVSIFASNLLATPQLLGTARRWPLLFAVPLLPAVLMVAALPKCRESPKWLLLERGRELQAQQALAWFRGTGDVQAEMDELRAERELGKAAPPISFAEMIRRPALRRPLTIAVVIMLSQQFSGINAVLFFSTSVFRAAGFGPAAAIRATLGMSLVNVLMTVVSLFLVDRAGRRTLHMTGLLGMALNCLLLALCLGGPSAAAHTSDSEPTSASYVAVGATYLFVAMFASGPGSIPWFLIAELFPSDARALASGIAVSANWLANFLVTLCFLPLIGLLHGYVFFLFAALLLLFYAFTYYKVPETKGATAGEISALFQQ